MTLDARESLLAHFPDDKEALHALKLDNAHFRAVSDKHETLSKEIYRIETEIEASSDERLETLKKERLSLLDQIAGMISEHRKLSA